jgi:hypothetical protein
MLYLLAIVTLIGITSGFFGQSIAWAAEQICRADRGEGKETWQNER